MLMAGMILALALTVLGAVADIYTTKRAVADRPQKFKEGNPIMRALYHLGGIWALAAFKLAGVAFVFWVVLSWQSWPTNLAGMFCGGLWLFMGWRNRKLIQRAAAVLAVFCISAGAWAGDAPKPAPVQTPEGYVYAPAAWPKGHALGAVSSLVNFDGAVGMGAGGGYAFGNGLILLGQATWMPTEPIQGVTQFTLPKTPQHPARTYSVPYTVPSQNEWGLAITLAFPFK
jgi:hypothetical protein